MTTKLPNYDRGRRTGMWATISAAVQGGWPQTIRLLVVFVVIGAIVYAVAATADGNNPVLETVRLLLQVRT